MSITALPRPHLNLYGVYHFPADGCCLLTLSPETLTERFLGASEDDMFPVYLYEATRFAIYYDMDNRMYALLPIFVLERMASIESLHINSCRIKLLSDVVERALANGGALTHLVAHVTLFSFTEDNGRYDMEALIYVLSVLTEAGVDFDISVKLDNTYYAPDEPGEVRARRPKTYSRGYERILRVMNETFPLDVFNRGNRGYPKAAYSSSEPDAEMLFNVSVEADNSRIHFYRNVAPMETPKGKRFNAFENLSYVDTKEVGSEMVSGYEEFVIFGDYMRDRIPVLESEVRTYLGLKVYIDGFGSQDVRKDRLAEVWLATKNVHALSVVLNSSVLPLMMAKLFF